MDIWSKLKHKEHLQSQYWRGYEQIPPEHKGFWIFIISHPQAVLDGTGGNRPGQVRSIWNILEDCPEDKVKSV